MAKSAAFGLMHFVIAFAVSYALSGSFVVAGAITLLEPALNTVAHYFFDRWWEGRHTAGESAAGAGLQEAGAAS